MPWQPKHCCRSTSRSLASGWDAGMGGSIPAWYLVSWLHWTALLCILKFRLSVWPSSTLISLRLAGSLLYSTDVAQISYVPGAKLLTKYFPCAFERTMVTILVCTFWARTNAALKGAPSGPWIVPAMFPPAAAHPMDTNNETKTRLRNFFILFSRIAGEREGRQSILSARLSFRDALEHERLTLPASFAARAVRS